MHGAPRPAAGGDLLDNFVIGGPVVLAAIVAASLFQDERGAPIGTSVVGVVFGGFALGCAAQLIAQVQWGQSLGKRALGIKVVRVGGQPIELWRLILLRNVALQALSQACGVVALIDPLLIFSEQRRCLHDYLADSIVVDAPKE